MIQDLFTENWTDQDGRPAGGVASSRGLAISWQNGPLGRGESRREPNGAFVETVIQAVIARIGFYQSSQFACDANGAALDYLRSALLALQSRTFDREARKVEGTHAK